jgi:thioredoxin reductase (NADPH)
VFDYDAIIVGGGPAGLAAGLYLGRANMRTLLLEGNSFGGSIKNIEWIENYPGFPEGVSGAELGSKMVDQACKYGLKIEQDEVSGLEIFSSCRVVTCTSGKSYTTVAIIIAGGSTPKKLGVPGEDKLLGRGVFTCALCDGGEFADRVVAVCGGGDSGITEALYMTKLASKVFVIEVMPSLGASAIMQDRAKENPKLEIRCGTRVEAISGEKKVEALELVEVESNKKETLKVDGVLVHIGIDPNTDYLKDIIPLDDQGQIIVNQAMETEVPYILAAGDIRSGSPRQVSAAVGDGVIAAIRAQRLIQEAE